MVNAVSRRTFLHSAALSLTALQTRSVFAKSISANDKLNIAIIGVGGQGLANFKAVRRENIVAVCDVDLERAGPAYRHFEKSKQFTDYRRMLDKMHASIDAVVISTPDHSHFHPAIMALNMGKHVYLEKPLAHSVWETRTITELAKSKGLATQLGAQRHAIPNMSRIVELIQTGAIGKVTEVHSWVNSERGMVPRVEETKAVPATLDYDLWLGPVEYRPYDPNITPYGWRFWWDFGTGETGNWGCHILDIPFWALELDYPTHVSAGGQEPHPEMTPKAFHSTLDFPAKGNRPAVKLHWYQAKGGPPILKELNLPAEGNTLFIGTEGMLLCGFDNYKLLPEEKYADFKTPEPFLPESPGFHQEFINACKGDKTLPSCHFGYSGPLAETVLLANIAFRSGAEFDWEYETLTCKGAPEAQELIKPVFKKGWKIDV